jgi:broad specificity phosphatase PhoE
MRVYLIRHAECEDNVVEVNGKHGMTRAEFNAFLRNAPHSPLTARGQEQAQVLVQQLAEISFARLYTSPLPRALATATVLAEAQGLTPVVIDDLRELMPPPLPENGRDASLRRLFLAAYASMLLSPASLDRLTAASRRARAVWQKITAEPAEDVAVVSHGWFITVLLLSLRFDPHWRILARDLANCGISMVASRYTSF